MNRKQVFAATAVGLALGAVWTASWTLSGDMAAERCRAAAVVLDSPTPRLQELASMICCRCSRPARHGAGAGHLGIA